MTRVGTFRAQSCGLSLAKREESLKSGPSEKKPWISKVKTPVTTLTFALPGSLHSNSSSRGPKQSVSALRIQVSPQAKGVSQPLEVNGTLTGSHGAQDVTVVVLAVVGVVTVFVVSDLVVALTLDVLVVSVVYVVEIREQKPQVWSHLPAKTHVLQKSLSHIVPPSVVQLWHIPPHVVEFNSSLCSQVVPVVSVTVSSVVVDVTVSEVVLLT